MNTNHFLGVSDEQLVKEYLLGDSHCFGVLYERYYSKVYSKCFSFALNHDDAFDMTQEILLKAISNSASFRGNAKFSTWLYSIAQNYCITHTVNRKKRYFEDFESVRRAIEERPRYEETETRNERERLEDNLDFFLALLPEFDRLMLELKYRSEYSVKELQKEFNLSASAVKMRLVRARSRMNQLLSGLVAA